MRVHRFQNFLVISLGGGDSVYIGLKNVKNLAKVIDEFVEDCEQFKFTESQFITREFE